MSQARILVVEDQRIVALDVQTQLMGLGYEIVAVASYGEEAVKQAEKERPDLVLMDIGLKGDMDGIEAAQEIRAHLDIPVIYLTAYADPATLARAKVTESFGYILKPFQEEQLATAIEIALYKHQMERRLRQNEQWLAATLTSIGDAVIATDAQGAINFMNPIAEALTGWKQSEAAGLPLNQVFHIVNGQTGAPCENPASRVLAEGAVVLLAEHTMLITRDGRQVPIDDSAAPICDLQGRVCGVVLVFRDISERVQAQEMLRQYASELEARNEELDAFASTVAHDLKSPLGTICGFADLLEEHCATMPPAKLQSFLRFVAQSAHKVNNIVDELLLLARLRDTQVAGEPLDMRSIVGEAMKRVAGLIQEYQVEVTVAEQMPVALGHGPWVEEVWVNYLSNAIKYGGQPPQVEVGAARRADGRVCCWVRDNGGGIAPEDQARLFTPFTRLEQVRAEGHGLGLSIVRRIVEKMGGEVGVESQVGLGSTFTFTLPDADACMEARGQKDVAQSDSELCDPPTELEIDVPSDVEGACREAVIRT